MSRSICLLTSIGETQVFTLNGSQAFFWMGKLDVDADGSPHAYHPDDIGLDYLVDAGEDGEWFGIACDSDGNPVLQDDGYYVSTTALCDQQFAATDQRCYVNAETIPYIVLPDDTEFLATTGPRLGDYAAVFWNGVLCYAIYADVGPESEIGEGSIALHQKLGNNPLIDGKISQGIESKVLTVVFPRSRTTPWTADETVDQIYAQATKYLEDWGGLAQLTQCFSQLLS